MQKQQQQKNNPKTVMIVGGKLYNRTAVIK